MIRVQSIEDFRFFINQLKNSNQLFTILGCENIYPIGGSYKNGTGHSYKYLLLSSIYNIYYSYSFLNNDSSKYNDIHIMPEYKSVTSLDINDENFIKCNI